MQFVSTNFDARDMSATSQFVYSGEELFTINPKIGEFSEVFSRRCTIFMQVLVV